MATFYSQINSLQQKTCPYCQCRCNNSRFQRHVSDCERRHAYKGKPALGVCPFNADHRIPEEQLKQHIMTCADSRETIRSAFETEKVPKPEVKDENFSHKWQTEDDWSEEYNLEGQSVPNTLDIFREERWTADQVFDMKFGPNGNPNAFTDNLIIQRMSYEERKKYKQLSVKRLRALKEADKADEPNVGSTGQYGFQSAKDEIQVLDHNSNQCLIEEELNAKKQKMSESNENSGVFRVPKTNPFLRNKGFGTESATQSSAKSVSYIGTGIGRGRLVSANK